MALISISSNADGGAHSKCIITYLSLDYYRIQKMVFLYFVRKNITKNTLTKTARSDSILLLLCVLELPYLQPQSISSIYKENRVKNDRIFFEIGPILFEFYGKFTIVKVYF